MFLEAAGVTQTIEIAEITSLDEEFREFYQVYPNPASSQLTVQALQHSENTQLEVRTMEGKLLLKAEFSGKAEVDISNLESGIYLLALKHGNLIHQTKIIKN